MNPFTESIDAGECVVVSGPSGAGKTLLLRAIADLDPHIGNLQLEGINYLDLPCAQWRRQVAYVPSESHWWGETVAAHFQGPEITLLSRLGFEAEAFHWKVRRLSSGERQRLGLARALSRQPKVLLLDEPTANLDPVSTGRVESLVEEFRSRGGACLWVTHDAAQKHRIGTRFWELDQGQLKVSTAAQRVISP